VNYLAEL